MTSLRHIFGALLLPAALAAGCAALRPPMAFDSAPAADASTPALRVEPVEGRPAGMVMRVRCECEPAPGTWLEVVRAVGEQPARTIRAVQLDRRAAAALADEGVDFFDRDLEASTTLSYRARLRADGPPTDPLERSRPVRITWQAPPPPPRNLQARSALPRLVELRWEQPGPLAALVFRRDVLDAQSRPRRLARLAAGSAGVFVDRSPRPGGVYAYRVALAKRIDGVWQFGPASDEIYVTVAAGPQLENDSQ